MVLMAHLDVVPVDPADPWQHDPFGAEIVDGQIWGRGTLDDKGALVAVCEAVEMLLDQGFTPAQDVWLSFGCDEEVSGTAARLAVALGYGLWIPFHSTTVQALVNMAAAVALMSSPECHS